jgi:Mn-dependent DtxR family transcriptional regulator
MGIQESGEMYLETIYVLSKKQETVRSVDIGAHMGYSKPSVSRAVGLLKNELLIEIDSDGFITLTKKGEELAESIYDRHTTITELLCAIGVDRETAAEDACKIEHVLSDQSFAAIKKYLKK